jgi:serine/threonine protein kinase
MRGGVVSKVDGDPLDDHIHRILSQSTFEFISRGTYGVVFRVTYTGTNSGFLNPETGEEVRVFILKAQGIDMRIKHVSEPEPHQSEADYEEEGELYPYSRRIEWGKLEKEVSIQQQIYACALEKNVMPPCPAILFYQGITAEQFERYTPGQLVYKNGYGTLEEVDAIERDLQSYRMGIILMEYFHAEDLVKIPHEIYAADAQNIKNKAFRAYCTALYCGVVQGDPKPQNFLLNADGKITLIDFGVSRKLLITETAKLAPLLAHAESGNAGPLRRELIAMEGSYKCLEGWMFAPELSVSGIRIGPSRTILAPVIPLPPEISESCKSGICKPKGILPGRKRISEETENQKRKKGDIERYEMEIERRVEDKKAEELERCGKEGCSVMGGKRHTKYVGTRRHKKSRTRRKV